MTGTFTLEKMSKYRTYQVMNHLRLLQHPDNQRRSGLIRDVNADYFKWKKFSDWWDGYLADTKQHLLWVSFDANVVIELVFGSEVTHRQITVQEIEKSLGKPLDPKKNPATITNVTNDKPMKTSLLGAITFLTAITDKGRPDYDCGDYIITNESEDGKILQGINLNGRGESKTFLVGGSIGQWTLNNTKFDDLRVIRHAIYLESFAKKKDLPDKEYIESVYIRAKTAAERLREIVELRTPEKPAPAKTLVFDIETLPLPAVVAKVPAKTPPRDSKGRFTKKFLVARFYYRKDNEVNYTPRMVTVAEAVKKGESDRFHGYDLSRKGFRTFRHANIKGGFKGVTFTNEIIK